ncbi:hypothetical protein [Limosilactobacillus reuteri]|uniref:Phage protein n=1 Tax=Limosilactobacillus reuteri TaxID=1598 RepID=A0ABD6Y5V9_LIMRT|nr:hypothetical protein [Limosilactobacillus reuteri]PWT37235.1 hypothetical protein DKZ35_06300 [Limosilactobacillus reuteri]
MDDLCLNELELLDSKYSELWPLIDEFNRTVLDYTARFVPKEAISKFKSANRKTHPNTDKIEIFYYVGSENIIQLVAIITSQGIYADGLRRDRFHQSEYLNYLEPRIMRWALKFNELMLNAQNINSKEN